MNMSHKLATLPACATEVALAKDQPNVYREDMPNDVPPPSATVVDSDGIDRVRFRLWQIAMAVATVILTVWMWRMGPIPGILMTFVAKHILVAILMVGLQLPPPKQ